MMELNRYIDHTLLKPTATPEEIRQVCREGKTYHFASVCVNPCYVSLAREELAGSDVKVCSVVGFPFGANTTAVKLAETAGALADGAQEIDMVIPVGRLLAGDEQGVLEEVQLITQMVHSRGGTIKVIVETCYLNEEQIASACRIVEQSGADFIKTSTGYGSRGATAEDIRLFRKYLKTPVKMKAAGGIRTRADCEMYLALGCERLGSSSGVKIMEEA